MRLLLLSFVVAGLGCAASARKADPGPGNAAVAPGATAPPVSGGRIKDSVPERSAALDDADRDLSQGATGPRFGLEEARARREAAKNANNAAKANADGGVEPGLGSNGSLIAPPRQ